MTRHNNNYNNIIIIVTIIPFTVPKSHQRGVAVVEEDSEPEEQEKNVPIIDSASREVEGKYWK